MSKKDRSAAQHVLHVKLEMKSYTGVNAWCDLRGNDTRVGKKTFLKWLQGSWSCRETLDKGMERQDMRE